MKAMRATSCLHCAVESGDISLVRLTVQNLLSQVSGSAERQSLIDLRDIGGRTALSRACQLGQVEAVEILLKNGADPASRDLDSNTPFIFACQEGHTEVVKYLMRHTRDFEDERNLRGVGYVHSKEVQMACQPHVQNDFGRSAAMLAAEAGHVDVLKALAASGVKCHTRDKNGRTALHYASEAGRLAAVKFLVAELEQTPPNLNTTLLEGGPLTVQTRDFFGQTALSLAEKHSHSEVVEFLQAEQNTTSPKVSRQSEERNEDTNSCAEDSDYEYQSSDAST